MSAAKSSHKSPTHFVGWGGLIRVLRYIVTLFTTEDGADDESLKLLGIGPLDPSIDEDVADFRGKIKQAVDNATATTLLQVIVVQSLPPYQWSSSTVQATLHLANDMGIDVRAMSTETVGEDVVSVILDAAGATSTPPEAAQAQEEPPAGEPEKQEGTKPLAPRGGWPFPRRNKPASDAAQAQDKSIKQAAGAAKKPDAKPKTAPAKAEASSSSRAAAGGSKKPAPSAKQAKR